MTTFQPKRACLKYHSDKYQVYHAKSDDINCDLHILAATGSDVSEAQQEENSESSSSSNMNELLIPIDKIFIQENCPYFKTMLSKDSNWVEGKDKKASVATDSSNGIKTIKIYVDHPKALGDYIKSYYQGELVTTPNDCPELYKVCDFLNDDFLLPKIEAYIENNINFQNISRILKFSTTEVFHAKFNQRIIEYIDGQVACVNNARNRDYQPKLEQLMLKVCNVDTDIDIANFFTIFNKLNNCSSNPSLSVPSSSGFSFGATNHQTNDTVPSELQSTQLLKMILMYIKNKKFDQPFYRKYLEKLILQLNFTAIDFHRKNQLFTFCLSKIEPQSIIKIHAKLFGFDMFETVINDKYELESSENVRELKVVGKDVVLKIE